MYKEHNRGRSPSKKTALKINPKHILIPFLLFLLVHTGTSAQCTITGRVVDAEQQPVEFATITLLDSLSNVFIIGTISDEEGYFELVTRHKAKSRLSVQYVGYKNWERVLPLNKHVKLDKIHLMPIADVLEEVVVTAKRPTIERIEDKLVFNVSSSPLKSGYNGMEVLERSPNVWIGSDGSILMRNEAAIVMVNGRQLNLSGSDLANYIQHLNAENIKRIELTTNASSNVDATNSGGVINIVLKKPPVGFNALLRGRYGHKGEGFYTSNAGGNFNYGTQKWNTYGTYNVQKGNNFNQIIYETNYFISDNYLRSTEQINRKDHGQNLRLGFVATPWKRHEFGAECYVRTGGDTVYKENDFLMSNKGLTIDEGFILSTTNTDSEVFDGTVNYSYKMDTLKSSLNVFVDYTHYNLDQVFEVSSDYLFDVYTDNREQNLFEAGADIYVAQLDAVKFFRNELKVEIGAKYTRTERFDGLDARTLLNGVWEANEQTAFLTYEEDVTAGFMTVGKKMGEGMYAKAGLRLEETMLERSDVLLMDKTRQRYLNWFPSFYFSKTFNQRQSISLSYNRRLRRPNFFALGSRVVKINDFNYSAGNPFLQPQFIGKYDLTFHHKSHVFSLYLNRVKDAINGIYLLDGEVTTYKQFNDGEQRQYGLEYSRSGKINEWWFLVSSAHFYHRLFIDEMGNDQFRQTSYNLRVSNQLKINETTGIDLTARFVSPKSDAFYEADGFYFADLFLRKTFFNKRLNIRVALFDIFNSRRFKNLRPFSDFETLNDRKPRSRYLSLRMSYQFANKNKTTGKKNKSKNEVKNRL